MEPLKTVTADLRFHCPFGMYVSGPTMSGKSTFVFELLKDPAQHFNPSPQRIVYAYSVWQNAFNGLQNVEFICGLESVLDKNFFDPSTRNLLIVDDLMEQVANNKAASTLFTSGIHHKNVSVIFMSQNLFQQGRSMRNITLNCQYIVIMPSPRDIQQIIYLARQTGLKHLVEAYRYSIKEPFGHLLISLHPLGNPLLQLQSNIFMGRKIHLPG